MIKDLQNRFCSWALWLALAALAVFLVKTFAGIDISGTVNTTMYSFLTIKGGKTNRLKPKYNHGLINGRAKILLFL